VAREMKRGKRKMSEKQLMDAVYQRAKDQNRDVRRSERMKTGTPDLMIETNRGLLLVELKFASSLSKRLFSLLQQHTIQKLNLRGNVVRACGLIHLHISDQDTYIIDIEHLYCTAHEYIKHPSFLSTSCSNGAIGGFICFNGFEAAFDYLVQRF